MPPLMGWTAAADDITLGAWALFATQFLWQFPHFLAIAWMYRDQYAKAGIQMLPVVEPEGKLTARQIVLFTVMLVPVSLAPFFLGVAGIIYLIGAIVLGVMVPLEKHLGRTRPYRTQRHGHCCWRPSYICLFYFILIVVDSI